MSASPAKSLDRLSAEAFLSLGAMEGLYEPIVEVRYLPPMSSEAYASFGSMEGYAAPAGAAVAMPAVPTAPLAPAAAARKRETYWPGYLLPAVTAVAAYLIHELPVAPFTMVGEGGVRHPVSAAIIAIVLGLAVRNTLPLPVTVIPGCKRVAKRVIPLAIVLTGAGLDLSSVAGIGPAALVVTILSIVTAMAVAWFAGRWLGVGPRTAVLIGAGTGICGNSAIVAVAPLIDADDHDLVLSVGTINLLGLLAMLACPLVGGLLHMGAEPYGIWAGATIHAVPQVVAAGFAHSAAAGTLATLVKLVRVTLLAPLVAGLAIAYARRHKAEMAEGRNLVVHYARFVPWFVWGFVLLAVANTLGLIPALHFPADAGLAVVADWGEVSIAPAAKRAADILLAVAMAAIGLELDLRVLASVGGRALATGLIATVGVALVSLVLIVVLT